MPNSADFGSAQGADHSADVAVGKASVSVRRIVDVEENIWAPGLGLKGKVDASAEVVVQVSPLFFSPMLPDICTRFESSESQAPNLFLAW
jgi:hypothetical protein